MPTPIFLMEYNGDRIYQIGRVGIDTGTADDGGVYTGYVRTEKWAPLGEGEDVYFRKVVCKVRHSGTFECKLRAYVDDRQTQYYSSGVLTNQEATFTGAINSGDENPKESLLEFEISARGNHIEVELEVVSNKVTGFFLPEYFEVHAVEISQIRKTGGGETT